MKYTDNYQAKLRIWATEGVPRRIPQITNLPKFGSKKFNSYEELNAWKRSLIAELIRNGGAKWK